MPPARRLRRFKNSKKKRSNFFLLKLLGLIVLLVIGIWFLTRTKYWDGRSKISIVIRGEDSVLVKTFDPELEEITTLSIPNNTQVEVARDLGKLKIGSVWQLGKNEKVGGVLLKETVVKNFHFPAVGWADMPALGFSSGEIKSVFSIYETNLSLGDKLRLYLFSLRVNQAKKTEVDVSQTTMLRKIKLVDGEEGYSITGTVPTKFIGILSHTEIANKLLTVSIKDSTGEGDLTEDMGAVIEYLGAKVVSSTAEDEDDLDCLVTSKEEKLGKILSNVFNCKWTNEAPEGNFDLELKIGKKFAERF